MAHLWHITFEDATPKPSEESDRLQNTGNMQKNTSSGKDMSNEKSLVIYLLYIPGY